MKRSLTRSAALATAVLVALSTVVLSAGTHAPNVFETGYFFFALNLNAPQLCDKISPETVEHGPIFGNSDMRIRYLQSVCFYDLAPQIQDISLCDRVRTISTWLRDGSGISRDACRGRVRQGKSLMSGNYATGLLLGVMGFDDAAIRKVYPDHPTPDRSYDFMSDLTFRRKPVDLTWYLARLPDFSRGDAQAIKQLYAAVPRCADRRDKSYECRRLRCALVRGHDGPGCERALEKERSPWQ
jgi:hypothetical protein